MKRKGFRLLLTGGGTGGHLFPAIATAEEVCARNPGTEVLFLGTGRKMDAAGLVGTGYKSKTLTCYGLKGKNPLQFAKALVALPLSFLQAIWVILRFQPDVVFGVGGYVTGPVVLAARLLGRRTIIHEQNSVPGMANKKLSRIAGTVCISLPQSAKYFSEKKTVLTGNPVRKKILELAARQEREEKESRALLILGGSLGAHRVNELVVAAVCDSPELSRLTIIHQTGSADAEWVTDAYEKSGVAATVAPFFTDMAEIYAQADLLVSRAGATTLAELAVLGKPAILIPYPYAADDHQTENAEYYVMGGGCRVYAENALNPSILARELEGLLFNSEKLAGMSQKMRNLGIPDAAGRIAEICLQRNGKAVNAAEAVEIGQ